MSDYRVDAQVNFDEMNNRVRFEIRRTVNALTLRLQRIVQEDMLSGKRLKVQTGTYVDPFHQRWMRIRIR